MAKSYFFSTRDISNKGQKNRNSGELIIMNAPVLNVPAALHFGRESIPVEASYASRYSISVKFLNGKVFPHEYIFSRLILHLNGNSVKLGPCKFLKNGDPTGKKGKLVFVKDLYDLNDLFYNKTLVKLQSSFINVPLILGHKDNIKPEFREYTANLDAQRQDGTRQHGPG